MSLHPLIELPHDIACIDTGLFGAGMTAVYLVRGAATAALIETGTTNTAESIVELLREEGLAPEDIGFVMPTHVHLDHAGGAGALLARLPRAQLVVHPRGARHMIDPAKLWAGAAAVYGEDVLLRDYGRLVPVPEGRMLVADDGCEVDLGGRVLRMLDTPGHARHHYSVWDERSRGFFTGDTFGVSYRQTDTEQGAFIMPTTSPVQFDPAAWQATLERYAAAAPRYMYLTHFSAVEDVPRLSDDLRCDLEAYVAIAEGCAPGPQRHAELKAALFDYTMQRLADAGSVLDDAAARKVIEMDMDLNAQGLGVWLDSR